MTNINHTRQKIYYHHTDSGGVVYYANYLKFLEEARTEFLEKRGIFIKDLISHGVQFVVSRQEIDYKSPSFYGDILQIETRISKFTRVKIEFEYEIKNQKGAIVCIARTIMACVDMQLKPSVMPKDIHEKLF